MLVCDLCKKEFVILSPFNFKDMVWKQNNTFQAINCNEDLKNYEVDLCYLCKQKVFETSVPCIKFRQDLFEALRDKKIIKKGEWF